MVLTRGAIKTMLSKTYDSASTYEVPSVFSIGTSNTLLVSMATPPLTFLIVIFAIHPAKSFNI